MLARVTTRCLLALAALVSGCDINPVPEPPSGQPLDPPQVGRITLAPDPMMAGDDIDVAGAPGTATPGSDLWAVNLDGTEPPVTARVQDDGSFSLTVSGYSGDELRLQVRSADRRSLPIDVIVPPDQGPAVVTAHALADCLILDPPLELELPAPAGTEPPEGAIAISNQCATTVVLDDIRLRVPTASFAVEPATLQVLGGATEWVTVRAYGADPVESILLLHVASPEADRRSVTLFGNRGATGLQPTCQQVSGACLSDTTDPTFPADCEALGQQTMQATCTEVNTACCAAMP